MAAASINGTKLKQAIDKFGSLQEAVGQLQKEKLTLKKQNDELQQQKAKLKLARDKLFTEVIDVQQELGHQKTKLKSLADKVEQHGRQYELFEGFLAMVAGSPSVTSSIETLIAIFQKLSGEGWQTSENIDDLRSLFARTVLGDYLKGFRCDSCGARFIVNKEPHYKFYGNRYYCPACHFGLGVKEDDSFLKAMVSEKQMENIILVEDTLKENEDLRPLKAFLDVPCEICDEPVKEWDDQNVKLAIDGIGCGHTWCWNSEVGQLRQLRKAVENFKKA